MKTRVKLDDIKIELDNREYSEEGEMLFAQLNEAAPQKGVGCRIPELRGTLKIQFPAAVDMVTMARTAERVERAVREALAQ